jgi:sec-independent protein translocase protein TatC
MAQRTKRGAGTEGTMSLGQHLIELRKRLFLSAIGILVGAVVGFIVAPYLLTALQAPILALGKSANASINYTTITEPFDIRIQVAIMVGIVISSPVWLYQVWAFIIPALLRKEKIYALSFFLTAVPLFLAGAVAGALLFPHMVQLLLSFAVSDTATLLTAKYFLDFFIKLVLAVGIAFVLPVFIVLFNFIGIISAQSIIKAWRTAILAIVLFTAIATPAADPISMFLLAIPMVVLYLGAYGVSFLHDRSIEKRAQAIEAELNTP